MPSEIIAAYAAEDVRAAEAQVIDAERPDQLMQRAAAGLAVACGRVLRRRFGSVVGRRVVLLVGPGNNGGDALLAGARLRARGAHVDAILATGSAHAGGVAALVTAGGRIASADGTGGLNAVGSILGAADLVVDGLVGLGGSAGLEGMFADLVQAIPADRPVVAVDLPSGVDPDTGEVSGVHVRADVTVTFGAVKACLLVPPAAGAAGAVEFVDVGLGSCLPATALVRRLTAAGVAARWPMPRRADDKYRRGVLGVVAGSDTYPGAAVLACVGAVRAGVGVVRYIGPSLVTTLVLTAQPEVVRGIGRVQAWLLGSGVEDDAEQDAAISAALDSGLPCVVDAGALDECVQRRVGGKAAAAANHVLLTPHAGELSRLLGLLGNPVPRSDVEARPLRHARWLAGAADATVLLKGSVTLIVDPAGHACSQDDGPAWLATAGSGDVLAGIAGALMAGGVDAMDAGSMAALVHGRAAAHASRGGPISAGDVAAATPATVAALLASRSGRAD